MKRLLLPDADVVFAASMNAENAEKLRELGVTLFVNDPKTIDAVMENIELIGQITDRQAEAKAVVDQMKQELTTVTDAVKSVKDEDKKKCMWNSLQDGPSARASLWMRSSP